MARAGLAPAGGNATNSCGVDDRVTAAKDDGIGWPARPWPARWIVPLIACLGVGIAAALPFAGHAGFVSRTEIALVPLGCDLNDFRCSTAFQAFWTPVIALFMAGAIFGAVAADRLGRSVPRRALATMAGGATFVVGALVTQATVGDNPLALWLNGVLGTATLDDLPVWVDVARQFGLSVAFVAALVTLAIGLVVRPRRAPAAALLAGLTAGLGFAVTTWILDQVVGITIDGAGGPSQMPRVALASNLVAGIGGSAVGLGLIAGRGGLPTGPNAEPSVE